MKQMYYYYEIYSDENKKEPLICSKQNYLSSIFQNIFVLQMLEELQLQIDVFYLKGVTICLKKHDSHTILMYSQLQTDFQQYLADYILEKYILNRAFRIDPIDQLSNFIQRYDCQSVICKKVITLNHQCSFVEQLRKMKVVKATLVLTKKNRILMIIRPQLAISIEQQGESDKNQKKYSIMIEEGLKFWNL